MEGGRNWLSKTQKINVISKGLGAQSYELIGPVLASPWESGDQCKDTHQPPHVVFQPVVGEFEPAESTGRAGGGTGVLRFGECGQAHRHPRIKQGTWV